MFHKEEFSSFAEFADKSANGQSQLNHGDRHSRTGDAGWAGCTWDEAVKLSKYGWAEGAKRIEKMALPLLDQISTTMRKPEIVLDIEGADIDVGAFMTGNPECFIRWDETEVKATASGRFVHIICNIAASSFFSTEELFAKGAAVSILVDALEMSGHRVTVDVMEAVGPSSYWGEKNNKNRYQLTIRIKNPEDPLNMESIAFACAHSGMLRRMTFSVQEQTPPEVRNTFGFGGYGSYGIPEDPKELPECDIYIGSTNSALIKNPLEWARKQLIAQGIEFNNE
jgi:hypothetical protein